MSPLKSRQPPTAQSSRPRSAPAPVACCHCDTARVVTNRALPASSHRASASPSQIAHASQPRTPRYVSGRMIDLRYASTDVPGPSAIAVSRRSSHLASSRDQPARTLAPLPATRSRKPAGSVSRGPESCRLLPCPLLVVSLQRERASRASATRTARPSVRPPHHTRRMPRPACHLAWVARGGVGRS